MGEVAQVGSVLEVTNLCIDARRGVDWLPVVRGVSFSVGRGEVLALVGESGSGKSLVALGTVDLLPDGTEVIAGETLFQGELLPAFASESTTRMEWRSRSEQWLDVMGSGIGVVLQNAVGSLEPRVDPVSYVEEALQKRSGDASEVLPGTRLLLDQLGVGSADGRRYGSGRSRGDAQRAVLAAALLMSPAALIADEPLIGLDALTAGAVLGDIDTMRAGGMAVVWVSNDLATVAALADQVAVVYGGRIIESGPAEALLDTPRHPYSRALLEALPERGATPIPGEPLEVVVPNACGFAPRCSYAQDRCTRALPELRQIGDSLVRCVRAEELEGLIS